MSQQDAISAWGACAPQGVGRLLWSFKRLGFARGPMKKILARLWAGMGIPTPVDIRYAGLKFRVHPWDNVVESKMLFGSKPRDAEEIRRLRDAVGDGGVFLDIGANIGYYALMALQHGARTVIAFEPNPAVFHRLQFNIEANGLSARISALPIALGDRVALTTMVVSDHDMGGSHIGSLGGSGGSQIEVQMKPLVDVLTEHAISSVDAMKIDVEGMEDAVLFPFFEHSPRPMWPRLVIIEHTSQHQWKRDILAWMQASGYTELERNRSNAMLYLK